jgi:hypothetical protein
VNRRRITFGIYGAIIVNWTPINNPARTPKADANPTVLFDRGFLNSNVRKT